jgi:hypothetical protein
MILILIIFILNFKKIYNEKYVNFWKWYYSKNIIQFKYKCYEIDVVKSINMVDNIWMVCGISIIVV